MRVEFKERARNFMYCRRVPKDVQQARNKCEDCCGGAEDDVFKKGKRCLGWQDSSSKASYKLQDSSSSKECPWNLRLVRGIWATVVR